VSDKELPIPGLEPFLDTPSSSFKSRREVPIRPSDRILILEQKVASLEMEFTILKIQMEFYNA
jgi:hypothetical protein